MSRFAWRECVASTNVPVLTSLDGSLEVDVDIVGGTSCLRHRGVHKVSGSEVERAAIEREPARHSQPNSGERRAGSREKPCGVASEELAHDFDFVAAVETGTRRRADHLSDGGERKSPFGLSSG